MRLRGGLYVENYLLVLAIALVFFATIANGLFLLAGLLALRCTMKLFTEYAKDRNMDRRMKK